MRKVAGVLLAAAMVLPVGLMASPAGAAGGTTCKPPSGNITVTPGYSTTPHPQKITFKLPLTGCKGGGVTGGTSVGVIPAGKPAACKDVGKLVQPQKIITTITWNTKAKSTFTGTSKVSGLTATVTGKVTTGLFKGLTVSTTVKFGLPGGCSATKIFKTLKITGTKPFVIK